VNIFSYIFPQTILNTSSKYNHDIRVIKRNGKNELIVNGIQQTGPYDTNIFDSAFRKFNIASFQPKKLLVLGVGGGYVIGKLHRLFSEVKIDAVDIDETIIDIAKTYFKLDSLQNIAYVAQDARIFVQKQFKHKNLYDGIIIDLYIGDDIPDFFSDEHFFLGIRSLLSKDGFVLINYQGTSSYVQKRVVLTLLLQKIFPSEEHLTIKRNFFFLLTNP